MSLRSWINGLRRSGQPNSDEAQVNAGTRLDTGGQPQPDMPDSNSTTGTTPNEEFVGRGSGDSGESADETGGERRARSEGQPPIDEQGANRGD